MAYRWLYKTWSVFWTVIGFTILFAILLGAIGFSVLQLPTTKKYIAETVEERYNEQHRGVLEFGKFDGTLPFNFQVSGMAMYADSAKEHRVFQADSVSASLDVLRLLSNRFVITGLTVQSPHILIDNNTGQSFLKSLQRIPDEKEGLDSLAAENPFVEILAPSVRVMQGKITLKGISDNAGDSLILTDMDLDMFLDYNLEERYFDIERLSMNIPQYDLEDLSLFGQVFNDGRYLEFNAFNVRSGQTSINFRGRADGVDILEEELIEQLKASELQLQVDEMLLDAQTLRRFLPSYPEGNRNVYISMNATGDIDSLNINALEFAFGESGLDGVGYIKNPTDPENIYYSGDFYNILLDSTELALLKDHLNLQQNETLRNAQYALDVEGSRQELTSALTIISDRGTVNLESNIGFSSELPLTATMRLDSVDLGQLFSDKLVRSDLNGSISFRSSSLNQFRTSTGFTDISLGRGSVNGVRFDSLLLDGNWQNGIINSDFNMNGPNSVLTGSGTVNIQGQIPAVEFAGRGRNIELKALTQIEALAPAIVDMDYEMELSGSNQNNLFGLFSIDIPRSVIEGDTLAPHQLYADFSEPRAGNRRLRITSTALDVTLDGNYDPQSMLALAPYWGDFFEQRITEEILLKSPAVLPNTKPEVNDQNLTMDLSLKSIGLLRSYLPGIPAFNSNMRFSGNVNANADRILFNSTLQDPSFVLPSIEADSLNMQITGSFRYDQPLKEFAGIQLQATLAGIQTDYVSGRGIEVNLNMDEDSIYVQQKVEQINEEASFNLEGDISLTDSSLVMRLDNFLLGSEQYQWSNQEIPELIYGESNDLEFREFTFVNQDEFISFEGIFSEQIEDSVNYVIRSVDLSRISQLINGRINFSGFLDGQFTTRTLTRVPTIQGALSVSGFALDNNTVGDVNINSEFNQDLNRFDTNITIKTDSTRYPDYYIRNSRSGQNIDLSGYVLAPENGEFADSDSLFKFELDFENIDLWVIPFIAPKVFSEMTGKATGKGYVWGNTETFDFSVDYQVGQNDAVYMRPRFLETYYYAQGDITFSSENGLDFQDVFIIDPSGGSAVLSGTYDLNRFQQTHFIDLRLEMDEFQFLNNEFSPTIPFFGEAYGSSTVRMTGTNINPVLSTDTPVYISDFSNIGIPLLEETEFDEDNKFIRFVDSFNFGNNRNEGGESGNEFNNPVETDPSELTFNERFTLDLQFIANNPMTVQLIFDPVTGDIIRADGTGRLRIRLEDEELAMFGQFDISGGSYQFVSGDIFTRRFELEPGGTITWDGEPDNAQLNLNAIYQARPDINTLNQARAEIDTETSQRVPVELVLNIGGSLSSIENEFFFRLPNTFESRQNTTLSAQIRALNRNEDEKLIQATSFLLMGDFIPSATAGTDATNSLTSNFSGSGAVLNPLLSSQVISPLLSRQINSLLRSDIGSLDIDFNLNTYNNVDLAVALRLYNDRIILSREGQITGSQSNIGDLGATYRINQTLSVTAFHRQDPTFSNYNSTDDSQQSQDINGVGLEAEVSFNTWKEFLRKITNPFRKLFGIKEENRELTQNENTPL